MTPPKSLGNSNKKSVIVLSIAAFAVLSIAISAIVGFSVKSVTDNANYLDDSRSRSTATAALQGLATKIESINRDNSIWEDAAVAVNVNNDVEWMTKTWGLATLDYPLFSEALVIESDGKPVIAYSNGEKASWSPGEFYGPSFDSLLRKANAAFSHHDDEAMQSAFAMTQDGLKVISIGPIRASVEDNGIEYQKRRFLIFSKTLDTQEFTTIADAYVLPGLSFQRQVSEEKTQIAVSDSTGQTIGFLAWPAQKPGQVSFRNIVPYLTSALTLLLVLLGGFAMLSKFLVSDINRDRVRAEHDSTHDPLSGLLNRAGLFGLLEKMIEGRSANLMPTLYYLDLDGFKDVNDTYGHAVGDELIRHVSAGLIRIAPENAQVSRLGGDEFAIFLNAVDGCRTMDAIAASIHRLFEEPFDINNRAIVVGASIGVALADGVVINAVELVRQADLAMYRAKDLGRGRTVLYETAFDEDRSEQNLLESDLREAIADNSLDVAFQPLVDAKTRLWLGVETLARWKNKRTGEVIGPDTFIALAERSGLIELLGLQILRKALTASKNWPGLKISVNVSPAQFRNPAFPEHVARILAETDANPKLLTLEITEGFFVRNPERAARIVKALKVLGISIALDDFGSGFSSVGYLRQFTFDRLKIDRSLISALDHEANAPNVIQATIALANAFNIPVTAEGVEREEQAVILRLSGCDELQGFLFGRPMPAGEINTIIRSTNDQAASEA